MTIASASGLALVVAVHVASGSGLPATPAAVTRPSQSTVAGTPTTTAGSPPSGSATTTVPQGLRSATGAIEQYGYGEISVRISVRGTRIVQATVANLQTAESYSQQLAQQAVPMLQSEVLSAQSAQISAISGATYTSQGYAASVQSALDQLGIK
jgi:uncharacterized protein with FMN-binding domain